MASFDGNPNGEAQVSDIEMSDHENLEIGDEEDWESCEKKRLIVKKCRRCKMPGKVKPGRYLNIRLWQADGITYYIRRRGNNLDIQADYEDWENEDASDDIDQDKCQICFANDADAVFYKCGHRSMCMTCAARNFAGREHPRCPFCQQPVQDVVKTYKS